MTIKSNNNLICLFTQPLKMWKTFTELLQDLITTFENFKDFCRDPRIGEELKCLFFIDESERKSDGKICFFLQKQEHI